MSRTADSVYATEKHMAAGAIEWPQGPSRLKALLRIKGLERDQLAKLLKVKPGTIDSWLCGARRPGVDVMLELAESLDMPVGYLYGQPLPHLDALKPEEAAARASLDRLLQQEEARMPAELRELLLGFARSPAAPRSLQTWRALVTDILEPSFEFGWRRHRLLTVMARQTSSRPDRPPKRT